MNSVSARAGVRLDAYRSAKEVVDRRAAARGWSVDEYAARADDGEIDALVRELLHPTTAMFRHAPAWQALRRALPRAPTLRAWVVGCATGEEAWTVAMCLAEAAAAVDVLATDAWAGGLAVAARGVVPDESGVPADLARRFLDLGTPPRVVAALRQHVRFAVHDLLAPEPPPGTVFSTFDLVSCRNVLLWVEPAEQPEALGRLIDAVEPGGLLLLGEADPTPALPRVGPGLYRR